MAFSETCRFYFAYGSNMNRSRMDGRGLDIVSISPAWIEGFVLKFNKRSQQDSSLGCANIAYDPSAKVEGVLYELKSVSEIAKLDPYEGTPRRYSREVFVVRKPQGIQSAWLYIANPSVIDNQLRPAPWYLDHLLQGRAYITDDYWKNLKATPCVGHATDQWD
ncbi:MAG: gamma-glutamylcyclotransferase family protein [Porticoccaceae bacterium]